MVSTKRLLQLARKWHKMAALGRRRISWLKPGDNAELDACSPLMPSKGTFVVYSLDARRFVVPLDYINTVIFRELFEKSKEEFGLPCDGPIVMPCDAALMEYAISLLGKRVSIDVEKAMVSTIVGSTRCSTSCMFSQGFAQRQMLVHGF